MGTEPGAVARFAREAEALGADSLWAGDRLLAPVKPVIGYGGGPGMPEEFRRSLDPFTVLAAAAAVTTTPLLGTSVLNAPYYSPAVLARSLTTIDVLSGGRLIPGFGTGWSPDEFAAIGVAMNERGALLDECLDVLEASWNQDTVAYQGRHFSIPESHSGLKPVQRPGPPVYLAGFAPTAMRRVATRSAGWLPAVQLTSGLSLSGIAAGWAVIREEAAKAGRPEPDFILRVNAPAGTPVADIVAAIGQAGRELSAGHVFVDLMYLAGSADQALELAAQVLAAAR
jgi:probable F420-dependent oxidoreductase